MDSSPAPHEQQRPDAAATPQHLRCTVYTAVTEGYDKRPLRFEPEEGVDREVRVAPAGVDGTRWNREQKLMHPPRAGLTSLYLDGSLSPKGPVRALVEDWLSAHDAAIFKHPHRTCAYAEIDACVARGKITADEGQQARGTLMLSGFPRDFGLWALGMIARRVHANALQGTAFPMVWHMASHIARDQIWFPFVLWKLKHSTRRIRTIEADIFDNPYFVFRRHGT